MRYSHCGERTSLTPNDVIVTAIAGYCQNASSDADVSSQNNTMMLVRRPIVRLIYPYYSRAAYLLQPHSPHRPYSVMLGASRVRWRRACCVMACPQAHNGTWARHCGGVWTRVFLPSTTLPSPRRTYGTRGSGPPGRSFLIQLLYRSMTTR